MKKYKVSLAVMLPYTWEIQVGAENGDDAIRKAADLFGNDTLTGNLRENDGEIELCDGYELSAGIEEIA